MEIAGQKLKEELFVNGGDSKMYGFFKNKNYHKYMTMCISSNPLWEDNFGAQVCENFLETLGRFDSLDYRDFKALMTSDDFMLFAVTVYSHYKWLEDKIIVESSDGRLCVIDKKVAFTGSKVFAKMMKSTGGKGKIPVIVSGDVLLKVIDFMKMHSSFREQSDHHKKSIVDFLKNNQNILPDLYEVADYLEIPSLLNLTSLVLCHIRSKPNATWQSQDFSNFFKSFHNGYKKFVNAKNAVISDLYQAANLADISSLLGSTSHSVEGMRGRTLDDILDCYAKLTFT